MNHEQSPYSDDPAPGRRMLRRALLITGSLYVLFVLSGWLARSSLPEGEPFLLEPRGWAAVASELVTLVVIAAFGLLYSFPALFVRRWIGLLLRTLMFFMFGVFLFVMQASQHIGVVDTPEALVCIRGWPFKPYAIPRQETFGFYIGELERNRYLHIEHRPPWGPAKRVSFVGVGRNDPATLQVLDSLCRTLEASGGIRWPHR